MSASVFAFPSRGKGPQPWTNDELAELYRVVDLLGRAGLAVATDMGVSDEGDPWFVFCRIDNDEVIAHFARIDGIFVAASIAVDETFRGANFRQIVDRMVDSQPLVMPRPNPGSKLFLHPAVMLTAFVATALAHSEKMIAQEWLRSVQAEWDHGKAAAFNELRHVKTAWTDTLHSLQKLPIEHRLGPESGKDSLPLTLASLIAIAMAALQPIADKIAIVAHIIADELPFHAGSTASANTTHAWQVAQDDTPPVFGGGAGSGGGHGSDGSGHGGSDEPQLHKALPSGVDGADSQKAIVESTPAVALLMAGSQKTDADTPSAPHASAAGQNIDIQLADLNGAFLLMQQKAIAAQQSVETFSVHIDSGLFAQSIGVQDVTAQALQLLSIKAVAETVKATGPADTAPAPIVSDAAPITQTATLDTASHETSMTAIGSVSPVTSSISSSSSTSTSPASSTSTSASTSPASSASTDVDAPTVVTGPTGNQIVDVANTPAVAVIQAISDFANNSAHLVAQQSIIITTSLTQELQSYFGSNASLKLVFFESTNAVPDVFLFSSGVVFVNEKDVSPLAHLVNAGGTLTLDETGGTVTLVGIATLDHTSTAV